MNSVFDFDTVALDEADNALVIIDQTLLPKEIKLLHLKKQSDIFEAIKLLRVRGAPAIGVAAGIGLYLASLEIKTPDREAFLHELHSASEYLNSARPTAVNLSWALHRTEAAALGCTGTPDECRKALHDECLTILNEDIEVCRRIGENGLKLLKPGYGILTHCNAGRLATVRYGTATSPVYLGHQRGYNFRVYCDETRPLLQGARLTSFELSSAGIDTTLICDNMAASLMKTGKIDAVITGCDRVAMNGDAANKIGTLGVAVLAKHFGIPFYIAAPSSTVDPNTATGCDIVIEERDENEICEMWYKDRMAPENVKTWNPAFDVTGNELISAIITEHGVIYPPYEGRLASLNS